MTSEKYNLPIWTKEEIIFCRTLYKRFLFLNKKYPEINFVPTKQIDEFWHNHILHTTKYHKDCSAIFGHYRHHTPSANTLEEKDILMNGFEKTQELYFFEFHEYL